MDDRSFDRLARILGEASDRRTGLKALVGGILGAGGMAALDADSDARRKGRKDDGPSGARKKKRKTCKPACGTGYECVKGTCTCPTGVTCGESCCRIGQVCEGGACVAEPEPVECIPAGEPCKNRGRRCCDGRVCASGQGGLDDVACYSPKTGACATTADCVYGMACINGRCAPPAPGALAQPCDAAAQQLCTTPGAVCTAYTGGGAPGGAYCTLPVGATCVGDPDCTCYKCFYANGAVAGGSRAGRVSANAKSCCFPTGQRCEGDGQCCTGLSCVNGTCGGTICTPAGGDCSDGGACCDGAQCANNVCPGGGGGGKQLGDECTASGECPSGSTCVAYATGSGGGSGTFCLLADNADSEDGSHCQGNVAADGKCRTCTVYYTNDTASMTALGAAFTAAEVTSGTPATIYVGPGTYKFTSAKTITSKSADGPITIQACDPKKRPSFDGGATVKNGGSDPTPTDNAVDLTWSGGNGILLLDGTSSSVKGFVIDGINFDNGNRAGTGTNAGAIRCGDSYKTPLTLKNSFVSRCKGATGGVHVLGAVTMEKVWISQCYGTGEGGALWVQEPTDLKEVLVRRNYAVGDSGVAGAVVFSAGTGDSLTLNAGTEITDNLPVGIYNTSSTVKVNCLNSAGKICGNGASPTGSTNCAAFSGSPYETNCSTVCKGGFTPSTTSGTC